MKIWYLNNSDEPVRYVGEATEGPNSDTPPSSLNAMFASIVEHGITIEGKTWIPPHRILKIDL